jgi:hypothetical protein
MRAILHAKFGNQLAKHSRAPDKVAHTSPSPQLSDNPVEEFEAALKSAGCVAGKQRPHPDCHLQRPRREASLEKLRNSIRTRARRWWAQKEPSGSPSKGSIE